MKKTLGTNTLISDRTWNKLHFWGYDKYTKVLKDIEGYPPVDKRFRAFQLTKYSDVQVVILGKEPPPVPEWCDGLAFSAPAHISPIPKTTGRVLRAYSEQLKFPYPRCGDLSPWARNGVLLLNSSLTYPVNERHKLAYTGVHAARRTHKDLGWYTLIIEVLVKLSLEKEGLVFMLWGNDAKEYEGMIKNRDKHLVLTCGHPSPIDNNSDFVFNTHFLQACEFLGRSKLMWRLM